MRLEGLGKLKKSTSSGLESSTFRFAEQCLNENRQIQDLLFFIMGSTLETKIYVPERIFLNGKCGYRYIIVLII
jgi:hypothetical protein